MLLYRANVPERLTLKVIIFCRSFACNRLRKLRSSRGKATREFYVDGVAGESF